MTEDACPECGSAMDRVGPPAGAESGADRWICPRCNHEDHAD